MDQRAIDNEDTPAEARKFRSVAEGSARYRQEIEQARQIAGKNSFSIIWQPICHECFLLKHFAGTEDRNHPDASACEAALLAVWPTYRKGLDATEYEREISLEHLLRARANLLELEAFLIDIGCAGR